MQHEINPIASKTIENLVAIRLIEKKLDTLHISTTAKQLRETKEVD